MQSPPHFEANALVLDLMVCAFRKKKFLAIESIAVHVTVYRRYLTKWTSDGLIFQKSRYIL